MFKIHFCNTDLTLGFFLFWKWKPEHVLCDVVENACGARGDSNSSSSRTPRGSAWLSWNQPGAKMWRWNRDQRCVGAELPSVSLRGEKERLTQIPTHPEREYCLEFPPHWKYSTLNCFWFFKRFPSPPSPGCVHLVNIWVESLVAKSEEHRFVFNDTTWRSNLLYGIVVNEGALF